MDLYPAIDLRGGRVRAPVPGRLRQGDGLRRRPGRDGPGVRRRRRAVDPRRRPRRGQDGRGPTATSSSPSPPRSTCRCRRAVASRRRRRRCSRPAWRRVVLGTAAVEDPELVPSAGAARHPGRVAVGLDHRDGEVMVRGWDEGRADGARRRAPVRRCGRRRLRRHRHRARRHARRTRRRRPAAWCSAPPSVAVIASGGCGLARRPAGLAVDGHGVLAGVIVGKALYEGRFTVEEAVAACAACPGHPVPRRRRRPRRQGRQLRRPARRRRPGRAGRPLRRRGRRRGRVPRHHRRRQTPRHDRRRRAPHGRAGVHPVHRRRRHPHGRRRPAPAAGRRRQGVGQHGGRRPARADRRDRRGVRGAVRGRGHRRPPGRRAASRSSPTAGASRPASTPCRGRPRPSGWARARSCSRRWTATARRTASTSS